MSRQELILVPSEKMDKNKKSDRNENGLIRMSARAREFMGYDDKVEVYPKGSDVKARLNRASLLSIFKAYSDDIKTIKSLGIEGDDLNRVGFVTTSMFKRMTGKEPSAGQGRDIWITNDINDTIIGTDPEFLLFNDEGEVVHANSVMQKYGPIGNDGAMCEVRPEPAISPEGLVENIKAIFANESAVESISNLKWRACCYYKNSNRDFPVGGHIHIGNPIRIENIPMQSRLRFFRVLNKIMDELLSIPMIRIDGKTLGSNRRAETYAGLRFGYYGELRSDLGRLEHRTLSGLWMMHPSLSTAVFGTAKAIIDEVYRHVADNSYKMSYMFPSKFNDTNVWRDDFDAWKDIPLAADLKCIKSSAEMSKLINASERSKITNAYLGKWLEHMQSFTTYDIYAEYINSLYEILHRPTKFFREYSENVTLQEAWLGGKAFG